jgi:hypothetical protein
MNLSIQPFESLIASAITGEIISGGQNGNAANIVKRANTALQVATAFQQLSAGNAAPGVQALSAALSSSELDPGVALAVQGVFGIAGQQSALISAINSAIPGLSAVPTAIIANVTAGIVAAANAEIAKYGTPAAAAA